MLLLTIIGLVWLVPLGLCLALAFGSLISPRFRRFCVRHLFDGCLRSSPTFVFPFTT
jgi:hypothetical protein